METLSRLNKNFCDYTKEDWRELMEEDERKRKEGKFKTWEEVLQYWKEKYGIKI